MKPENKCIDVPSFRILGIASIVSDGTYLVIAYERDGIPELSEPNEKRLETLYVPLVVLNGRQDKKFQVVPSDADWLQIHLEYGKRPIAFFDPLVRYTLHIRLNG